MKHLKTLLELLARGRSIDESWSASGYSSLAEARAAMEGLARSFEDSGASGASTGKKPRGTAHAILNVDGASRGNPGPSAVGIVITLPSGEELYSVGKKIGRATNNVAEYRAVIEGLKVAGELGIKEITVRLDSELVMKQLTGVYRIKSAELESLARQVAEQLQHFSRCSFEHVTREGNREADRIANRALSSVVDP